MHKETSILKKSFSIKASIVLMLLLMIVVGIATFVEDRYDTVTAQLLIYNSVWFESLLFLLSLLFLVVSIQYGLFKTKKIIVFIFHIAFLFILIGAFVTRYFGWDGEMYVPEKFSSDTVYVRETSLMARVYDNDSIISYSQPVFISQLGNNNFSFSLNTKEKGQVYFNYVDYKRNVKHLKEENQPLKNTEIELNIVSNTFNKVVAISKGQILTFNGINIGFEYKGDKEAVSILEKNDSLKIESPIELIGTLREDGNSVLHPNFSYDFQPGNVFNTQKGIIFRFLRTMNKSNQDVKKKKREKPIDELILNIKINKKNHKASIFGGDEHIANFSEFHFEGLKVELAYGFPPHVLPFKIHLDKLIVERFPGTNTLSSQSSKITIIDNELGTQKKEHLALNKVVDYRAYRFFQTSIDKDEKGSIIFVNYDEWGTNITYFGYFLLFVGLLLLPFSKQSRFRKLFASMKIIRSEREML